MNNIVTLAELKEVLTPVIEADVLAVFDAVTAILDFTRIGNELIMHITNLETCQTAILIIEYIKQEELPPQVKLTVCKNRTHIPLSLEVLARVGDLFKFQMLEINKIVQAYPPTVDLDGVYDPSDEQFLPVKNSALVAEITSWAEHCGNFDYNENGTPNESPDYKLEYRFDGTVAIKAHKAETTIVSTVEELAIIIGNYAFETKGE